MPKRWKCLLAGPPEAGKSTLCAALLEPGSERRVIKTQSPVFHKDLMVDLPGEYITYPQRRTAFLVAAEDVRAILYVQSATAEPAHVPPGLLQTVPNLLIAGIISKIDHPGADIPRAERGWRAWPAGPFFTVSAFRPETLEPRAAGLERMISSRAPEPGRRLSWRKAL
ncbi:MAG: EutP/PduV family microcompartment system protein [Bilophila wadsworthia]